MPLKSRFHEISLLFKGGRVKNRKMWNLLLDLEFPAIVCPNNPQELTKSEKWSRSDQNKSCGLQKTEIGGVETAYRRRNSSEPVFISTWNFRSRENWRSKKSVMFLGKQFQPQVFWAVSVDWSIQHLYWSDRLHFSDLVSSCGLLGHTISTLVSRNSKFVIFRFWWFFPLKC